jgi:hypothetical protein
MDGATPLTEDELAAIERDAPGPEVRALCAEVRRVWAFCDSLRRHWEAERAEVARLRDADAALARWGRLRAEYAALRGRQDHAPTHEESVAAWARMEALEAEIEQAFLAVRVASDVRASACDKPR